MFEKLKRRFARPARTVNNRWFSAATSNRLMDWPVSYQRVNGDLWLEYAQETSAQEQVTLPWSSQTESSRSIAR